MTQTAPAYRPSEKLAFCHATDSGGIGSKNADAYLIFPSIGNYERTKSSAEPIWYALLADGVGDDAKGRIASQLAVETVYKELMNAAVDDEDEILYHLEAAFQQAHGEILRTTADDPSLQDMTAAMIAAAIAQNRLYLAYTGNCSAYLVRHGMAARLTLDAPGSLYRPTLIDETFIKRNLTHFHQLGIQSFLGVQDHVEVNSYLHNVEERLQEQSSQRSSLIDFLELQEDDVVLFCSSGLSASLSTEEIADIVNLNPVDEVAEQLIASVRRGGVDENATALVIEWKGALPYVQPVSIRQTPKIPLLLISLLLLLGIFLAYNSSLFLRLGTMPSALSYIQTRQNQGTNLLGDSMGGETTTEKPPVASAVLPQVGSGDGSGSISTVQSNSFSPAISNTSMLAAVDPSTADDGVNGSEILAGGPSATATATSTTTSITDTSGATAASVAAPVVAPTETANVADTPTSKPTARPTATDRATSTQTALPAATPTVTATPSPAPTQTPLPTQTPSATVPPLTTATPVFGLAPTATLPAPPATAITVNATDTQIVLTGTNTTTIGLEGEVREIYILKKDDNLWAISFERGLTVEELLAANPQIRDKDQVLQPGMALIIPQKTPPP